MAAVEYKVEFVNAPPSPERVLLTLARILAESRGVEIVKYRIEEEKKTESV